jgi:hypothetical protein
MRPGLCLFSAQFSRFDFAFTITLEISFGLSVGLSSGKAKSTILPASSLHYCEWQCYAVGSDRFLKLELGVSHGSSACIRELKR